MHQNFGKGMYINQILKILVIVDLEPNNMPSKNFDTFTCPNHLDGSGLLLLGHAKPNIFRSSAKIRPSLTSRRLNKCL